MKQNIYNLSAKVIGCLLVIFLVIAVVYGINVSSKRKDDSQKLLNNGEEVEETYTETFKIKEFCNEKESCTKATILPMRSDKDVSMVYKKTVNSDGSITSSLSIDDQDIDLGDASEIYEYGILKSKYFIISYEDESKTFYYLDSQLREVKKISHISEDVDADSLEYTYYTCTADESAKDGMIRKDYKVKIDNRGTFTSSIINTEEGNCQ